MRKSKQRDEREMALMKEPGTLAAIVDFVASSGTLGRWCQEKDVRYHHILGWIEDDKLRAAAYARALAARLSRLGEKVDEKLHALLDADSRKAYDRNGKLLAPNKLPDSVAVAVTEFTTGGRNGDKLKLVPPDRAVELGARRLGLFREKIELEVTEGLGARLDAARRRVAARK